MQLQRFHFTVHRMFPSENLKIYSLRLLSKDEGRSWCLLVSSHIEFYSKRVRTCRLIIGNSNFILLSPALNVEFLSWLLEEPDEPVKTVLAKDLVRELNLQPAEVWKERWKRLTATRTQITRSLFLSVVLRARYGKGAASHYWLKGSVRLLNIVMRLNSAWPLAAGFGLQGGLTCRLHGQETRGNEREISSTCALN